METHGDTLAEELITEILLRLPVKSLLRFRCVSKSWLSLIASPRFVKSHLLLSATNKDYTHHRVVLSDRSHDLKNCYLFDLKNCSLSSLLCGAVIESFDLDYPGKYAYGRPYIVGSFNGLICLSIWGAELYLFLCNPSLKKYKKLPDGGFNCDAAPKFGFAYDDSRDDYKVVCFFHVSSPGGTYGTEVKIYSLKSDSWKRVDGFQGSMPLGAPGKLVSGKLHWYSDQNVISLDLADEKWAEVVMPHFKQCLSLELGVFGSHLSAMCNYAEGRKVVADVWVMKEYGVKESWTKMFTIKSPNDFTRHISPPIFMSNEGEILLQCGSCLVKYNPKDDSIKSLNVTNSALHGKAQIYVKSLVCPF